MAVKNGKKKEIKMGRGEYYKCILLVDKPY
jgi:hypothetical protein